MNNYTTKSRDGFDWLLFGTFIGLVITGLLMVYTTTYHDNVENGMWHMASPFGRQLIWVFVSLIAVAIISNIDWKLWNTLSLPLYLFGLFVLLSLFLIGTEVKGATSWIRLGPFSIQPSELVKLTTVFYAASLLSSIRIRIQEFKSQLQLLGVMVLPAVLIILQPDPGSALTYLALLVAYYRKGMPSLYYVAGIALFLTMIFSLTQGFYLVSSAIFIFGLILVIDFNKSRYQGVMLIVTMILATIVAAQYGFLIYALGLNTIVFLVQLFVFSKRKQLQSKLLLTTGLVFLCFLSFSSSYVFNNVLKPHQQDRINVWLQPEKCDSRGALYNLIQAKLAIGSGGLTGKGYLEGNFTKFNYVPEQTTDFIFSSIGEEQGFVGSVAVIVLFMVMIFRIIQLGEKSKNEFAKYLCYGISGFFFIHVFINIGMTMGITPVIGIPLPFISKGGSSLLAFSMMIGVALSISRGR